MARLFALASIVAHQGGWDEIALVGGPILVIIVVLTIVKRRVDAADPSQAPDTGDSGTEADHATDDR